MLKETIKEIAYQVIIIAISAILLLAAAISHNGWVALFSVLLLSLVASSSAMLIVFDSHHYSIAYKVITSITWIILAFYMTFSAITSNEYAAKAYNVPVNKKGVAVYSTKESTSSKHHASYLTFNIKNHPELDDASYKIVYNSNHKQQIVVYDNKIYLMPGVYIINQNTNRTAYLNTK